MRFKTIATVASILTFINASFFLFFPAISLSLLGRSSNLVGIMNTQIAGACALGIGSMTWMSRNTRKREVIKIITWGNLIAFGFLIFIDFYGVFYNAINELGWLIFLADAFIFCGFLISHFTFGGTR